MAKIENYPPGTFCWAELATSDQTAAKAFYSAMFGWEFDDMPIPGGVYTIFRSGADSAAATYTKSADERTQWKAYFSVTDVDESAAKVTAAGGNVIFGPFDVNDAGRMAQALDPQGALFCLWQGKRNMGAQHGGPLNYMSWPELATPDASGAVAFYSALFDWKTKPESGFDAAQYIEWINAGKHMGGLMPMRGEMWKGVPPTSRMSDGSR